MNAHTYHNDDGVLVVDAGTVVLESTAGLDQGPTAWPTGDRADGTESEVTGDVVRDPAGE